MENEKHSSEDPVTLGLVCVGGCGTNNAREVMRTLDPDLHPHLRILVCNTDRPQLENHFVEKEGISGGEDAKEFLLQKWLKKKSQFSILHLGESGMGAGGKPEEGARVAGESINEIEKFCQSIKAVVVIGGGGKGTGSGALPVIAAAAKKAGKSPLCILTMPRFSEGGRRLKKAEDTRRKLIETCPTAVVYNQQMPDTSLTYTKVWTEVNQSCLLPMLLVLQEIILEVADLNIDLKDWEAILQAGNYIQFGRSDVTCDNAENFDKIADTLLNNPYQDTKIMSKAREILLWLHGEWTVDEHDKIVNHIQNRMEGKDISREEIEITPGLYQTTKDDKKWVAVLVVAKDPPPDTVTHSSGQQVSKEKDLPPAENTELESEKDRDATRKTFFGSAPREPEPATRNTELNVSVRGEFKTLKVSPETASKWNRVFISRSVRADEINNVREKISDETGFLPDMPKHILTNGR